MGPCLMGLTAQREASEDGEGRGVCAGSWRGGLSTEAQSRRPALHGGGNCWFITAMFLEVYFVPGCVCELTHVIIIKFNRPCQEGAIIIPVVQWWEWGPGTLTQDRTAGGRPSELSILALRTPAVSPGPKGEQLSQVTGQMWKVGRELL